MREELAYLESLKGSGIRPGLDRMRALLAAAGDPHRAVPAILIAGTNGKGSTAATLHSILQSAGLRSGLYTSPHLVEMRERWRIGKDDATDEAIRSSIVRLRAAAEGASIEPTYFEALTIMAFTIFAESRREVAVLEVGMGGRLDATNVVSPLVALISRIGRDHAEYLGETLEEIAAEKAGIIHPGCVAATSNDQSAILGVLQRTASEREVRLHVVSSEVTASEPRLHADGMSFTLLTPERRYDLSTPLRGAHQVENVALAVRGAELLRSTFGQIGDESIVRGVAKTAWRGRLEHFSVGAKTVVVDGGHNAQAIERVIAYVRDAVPAPRTLVFGMMQDKDPAEAFPLLLPLFERIVVTEPDDARATPVATLREIASSHGIDVETEPSNGRAFERALELPPRSVVVCGSLYIAGAAIAFLDRIARRPAARSVASDSASDV